MALAKPRDYQTYADLASKNLTAGEGSNALKRVDGEFFDTNNSEANSALAVRAAWGADFTDEGSDAANGYYGIPEGIVDAEHYVIISDGTRVWKVQAFADDEVKITDSEIVNGAAGPADYSNSTFIDSLHLWVDKTDKAGIFVDKTQIVLNEDAPNALTGEDIHRAAADSSDLDADLTAVETAFAAEHNASTGAHDAGFLTAAMLSAADVFDDEGFVNFIRNGSFERWPQGPNNAPESEGWDEYNATVTRSDTQAKYGTYSAYISAVGANQGIVYSVSDYANYAGRAVTVSAPVYLGTAGDVEIRIDDGVGTTTGTAVTLAASWQLVTCTHNVDANASELSVYIVSSGGSARWYLDGVIGTVGDTVLSYGKSVADFLADDDVVPVNWLLNPGFETRDQYGTATCDSGDDLDYWVKYGLGNLDVTTTTTALSGFRCLRLGANGAIGANTGVYQAIGELEVVAVALKGKTVCFSVWLQPSTATGSDADGDWKVEIYDGTTTTYTQVDASDLTTNEWTQVAVVAALKSDMVAGELETRIYSVDGEDSGDVMLIDGACLNVGSRPMPGAGYSDGLSAWRRERYVFQYAGELSGDAYVGLWQPTVCDFYPTKIDVYCGRGPGQAFPGGYADYTLHSGNYGDGESATNLACRLDAETAPDADGAGGGSTNTLANANTDKVGYSYYLRVYQDQDGTNDNPEDITAIITGFSVIA